MGQTAIPLLLLQQGSESSHLFRHIPVYGGTSSRRHTRAHSHAHTLGPPPRIQSIPEGPITLPPRRELLPFSPMAAGASLEDEEQGKVEGPERTPLPLGALPLPPPPCLLPLSYVRAMLMTPENPSNATPVSGHVTT